MTRDGINRAAAALARALAPAGGDVTDGELLDRYARRRDEAAFAALVRRHGPMVLGTCRRILGNAADAEDAFQATFLVLIHQAGALRRRSTVGPWLYGVARNTALKARARDRRRRDRERQAGATPPPEAGPWAALVPLLEAELSRLPAYYRAAIVLCDLEGRTIHEAARQLGWPPGTAATRLRRGRELLARRLARRGLPLTAAGVAALLPARAAAAVPAPLLAATAHGAARLTFSPRVLSLAEGVLDMLAWNQLRIWVAAALLFAAVCLGARTPGPGGPVPRAAALAAGGGARAVAAPRQPQGHVIEVDSDEVLTLAISPDGQLLAGGGMDNKIRLWDLRTNQLARTLDGPKGIVRRLAFSKDGKTLAAGADDGGIHLWEAATGKSVGLLEAAPGFVNGLVLLAGGNGVAAAYNRDEPAQPGKQPRRACQIQRWDLRTRKAQMLYDQPGSAYDLAVSPDGALLAATLNGAEEGEKGYHGVKAWDLATGKQAWEVAAMEPEFMTAVAFAPDGQALAIGGALSIRVEERGVVGYRSEGRLWCYGTASRQLLWQAADESNGTYNALAFTPDGTGVLTGSSGPIRDYQINGARGQKVTSELRRWDAATGKPVWRTEAELGGMHALAVAPDGGTIAGADHEQVMVFDPASGLMREVLFKRTMTPKPPKK